MAVKDINEYKPKKKRRIHATDFIWIAIVVIVATVGAVRFYTDRKAENEINEEITRVSLEYASVEESNRQMQEILDDEDHLEYYEEVARRDYDYCYPDEEVYYNELYGE